MQGKTHLAAGIGAAVLLNPVNTLPELVLGIGAACIGSIICDVDHRQSTSRGDADKAVAITLIAVIALAAVEWRFHLGILDRFTASTFGARQIAGALGMIVMCALGILTSHRRLLHSLVGMGLFSACVWLLSPFCMFFFLTAYASHLVLDLFNMKGIQLYWPMKNLYCLKMFKTGGVIDHLIFLAFLVIDTLTIYHKAVVLVPQFSIAVLNQVMAWLPV